MDMGTALAARLGLGLLLLALLFPAQTYCDSNGTSLPLSSNNSIASSTSMPAVTNSLNNTTTGGHGNSLHSTTALLFLLSISLLHFCC